jgi:hypothetical protein
MVVLLPRVILQGILKFLGIAMVVPHDFDCPICMSEKTVSLSQGHIQVPTLLSPDWSLHPDGFWSLQDTLNLWFHLFPGHCRILYHASLVLPLLIPTHTPIKNGLWFIHMAHHVLGFSVTIVCTNGGGESWGSNNFHHHLFEEVQVVGTYQRQEVCCIWKSYLLVFCSLPCCHSQQYQTML